MNALQGLDLTRQLILLLAALVLFSSFAMLAQSRLVGLVRVFAWQGVLLAVTTGLVAYASGHTHLYASAVLTFFLKGLLIPWILHRMVLRLGLESARESDAYRTPVQLAGAGLVVFSYYVALPVVQLSALFTRNTIAVSLAVVLLGMLLMISRHKAVSQVVGFMSIENGLFFAAVVATYGMPMVVELGVAFDVLVAAILFGVVFLQIRASIDTLDVDRLNRLSESEP